MRLVDWWGAGGAIQVDASPAVLVEKAVKANEGHLSSRGALRVETGKYTGMADEVRAAGPSPL